MKFWENVQNRTNSKAKNQNKDNLKVYLDPVESEVLERLRLPN